MTTKYFAIKFMNAMASGLKIVAAFPMAFNQIFAIQNYKRIAEDIREKMDSYWCDDNELLLINIEQCLSMISQESEDGKKFVMALEFCKWMDDRITYMQDEKNELGKRYYFSLYWLLPITNDEHIIIESLNTNLDETGIWINPKFKIASPHVKYGGETIEKTVANRDVFEGVNGILKNCSYISWDKKNKVKNVIISDAFLCEKADMSLRIAFTPLSDKKNLIQTEEVQIDNDGILFAGVAVKKVNDQEEIYARLKSAWELSCDHQVDIFFGPELLGTHLSEKNDGIYNEMIMNLSRSRLERGEEVPKLTILPSYWENQKNSATIVSYDGEIIARQKKHVRYVDRKNNKMEALAELREWKTVLLHIPGIHRIVIMICAEFLAKEVQKLQEFICGSLGATLLIVPSYSIGEQDFVNELSSLKSYGTTVVWGNCCGAIKSSERAIGGCGIAGTTKTNLFGSKCKCEFVCDGIDACVFLIDIPLNFHMQKIDENDFTEVITHEIKKHVIEEK